MLDDNRFCFGCLDGKIKVENFSKNEKEYLYFNAHKNKQNMCFGVNWVVCNEEGLMSAGDDGNIYQWNLIEKRREKHLLATEYPIHRFCIGKGLYTCEMHKDVETMKYFNHLQYNTM